jgi:large subunit ribosomal protein L4
VAEIKAPLFTSDGTRKGDVTLDPNVFGVEPNIPVMHQVVTAQLAAARSGTASTKTRSEVRGGGRKPWRQKGLGRARHGSIRAPQWTGGGVAFGPKPRDYSQRTPKKMKRLALFSALSARANESEVRVIEGFEWAEPKTKTASALLEAIEAGRKVMVVLGESDAVAERSFRNLPHVLLTRTGQLTTYDVLWAETVVFTSASLGAVSGMGSFDVAKGDFVKESSSSKSSKTVEQPSSGDSDSAPETADDEGGEG